MRPLTIEAMQAIATARGGRCLSDKYVNNHTPLEWECAEGHRWFALPSNVKKHGSWCNACAVQNRRLSLDDVQRAVAVHGGRCLSSEYINDLTPLEFECATGHRWQTTFRYIRIGRWCWNCRHEESRDTIEMMRALAAEHGGECLSERYENQRLPLRWRCAKGHEWTSLPTTAKKHWCMRCYRERRRLGIEMMREIAASRDGHCRSEVYVTTRHPLTWECRLGHVWSTRPASVLRGHWCPLCANLERSRNMSKRLKWDFEG